MFGENVLRVLVMSVGLTGVGEDEADKVRSRGPRKDGRRAEMLELDPAMAFVVTRFITAALLIP